MEERGSEKGASSPQPEGDGLLEGGKLSKNRSTTLQEPTGEEEELLEEEGLDLEIETEKRRISEEEYQRRIRDSCESCGGLEEEQEMVKLGLDVVFRGFERIFLFLFFVQLGSKADFQTPLQQNFGHFWRVKKFGQNLVIF